MACMKSSVGRMSSQSTQAIVLAQRLVQPSEELLILARIRDEDFLRPWQLLVAGRCWHKMIPQVCEQPLSSRFPGDITRSFGQLHEFIKTYDPDSLHWFVGYGGALGRACSSPCSILRISTDWGGSCPRFSSPVRMASPC